MTLHNFMSKKKKKSAAEKKLARRVSAGKAASTRRKKAHGGGTHLFGVRILSESNPLRILFSKSSGASYSKGYRGVR
jgi:hypothetical protein